MGARAAEPLVADPDEADIADLQPAAASDGAARCLYPLYFDARRSRRQGRRVARDLAVGDPLAVDLAQACARLGLAVRLEPEKRHPKDWANPGRVRIGALAAAPDVANKHHLYLLVARQLAAAPTTDRSLGLRVPGPAGEPVPPLDAPYPRPAVPRGWTMGQRLPYLSPAMSGGGVSDNLFRDMMNEMQHQGAASSASSPNPMAALMNAVGGPAAWNPSPEAAADTNLSKKDKKKKKARA